MHAARKMSRRSWDVLAAASVVLAAYCGTAISQELKIALSGSHEIPPVTTSATGAAIINVGADKAVRGSVTVSGLSPTAVHIHEAPAGKNGPIVIPLTQTGPDVWSVPENIKLTDVQFESFKSGNLYVNVHTVANRGGEIRGQIKP
jgi:hypothetical protein